MHNLPTTKMVQFCSVKFSSNFAALGDFLHGFPAQAEFCESNGVDKHRVLTELLHAFGIMAFKDGQILPTKGELLIDDRI